MSQYLDVKGKYSDKLVLFRMGDFYETFNDDAKLASRVLGITLTTRDSRSDNPTPMAGIPHHALEDYLPRLIQAGHKVAICDQVEDPATAKGIVKREVVRVVTSGTLTEDNLLQPNKNNYLMCTNPEGDLFKCAWMDFSTGEIFIRETHRDRLIDFLNSLMPDELVVSKSFGETPLAAEIKRSLELSLSLVDDWNFAVRSGSEQVCKVYEIHGVQGLGLEEDSLFLKPLGALLRYLEETQCQSQLHLQKVRTISTNQTMILDRQTCRNLEIFQNQQDGGLKGTLYQCLNETATPMGARRLGVWLSNPLLDREKLERRLDMVEAFKEMDDLDGFIEKMGELRDLERPMGRVRCGRYNSRDLRSIVDSLKLIPVLNQYLEKSRILADVRITAFNDLVNEIDGILRDELPMGLNEGGMIRDGVNAELDELRSIKDGGRNYLKDLEAKLREDLGLTGLKVRQNKVFGFYIEVPKAQSQKVPEYFVRRQTLVNAERYIIPELKEYEDKIFGAEEKIFNIEFDMVEELRSSMLEQSDKILQAAHHLSGLDVLSAFAKSAMEYNYVRPDLSDEPMIKIEASRHPVVEKAMSIGEFFPNDIQLTHDGTRIMLLTGPNMAGKSTFIRQIGLIQIMCQIGSFVPATTAKMSLVDRVFSRVGAGDDLSSGRSTFMVEMNETANILHNATHKSLVILDEVGRGTSTLDGLSLAWSITEELHNHKRIRPIALFATHYHELTALAKEFKQIGNFKVAVEEHDGKIVFLHRIEEGFADKSYGIHVAKLAGLPEQVVRRAWDILGQLEDGENQMVGPINLQREEDEVQPLFGIMESSSEIENKLAQLSLDEITPIQALVILKELKDLSKP